MKTLEVTISGDTDLILNKLQTFEKTNVIYKDNFNKSLDWNLPKKIKEDFVNENRNY